MRKLREVMRLRFELHLGYQQIGRSCAIAVSSVHKYLKLAEAAGVSWPLPEDWDEARVEAVLFPEAATIRQLNAVRTPPDFAAIHQELQSNKHVTLQLLWEEYRQANPDGYRYSRYCYLYQHWRSKLDVVLRQEHKAGEKMFVDWAGPTIPVYETHHRPGLAGIAVRRCPGGQFLYVCRGHSRSADGIVDSGARPRF